MPPQIGKPQPGVDEEMLTAAGHRLYWTALALEPVLKPRAGREIIVMRNPSLMALDDKVILPERAAIASQARADNGPAATCALRRGAAFPKAMMAA
ncbi:hypothetical protein G7Z17_g11390 [Cylindrodendrum hubeiense]|uniref:Uncharacterized protein n=1 Tax=Cylindrodendrum hubeiense TaxID=595255 RepID=A0A9P5H0V4_9HYPO|nr:hypothetical protein G7Z17_g11390 [Cylindrodendrum hubeiense]